MESNMEIAKFILSIITVIVSIIALFISINANKKSDITAKENTKIANENTRIANGTIELQIRKMISESRRHLSSCLHEYYVVNQNSKSTDDLKTAANQLYEDAKQDFLNTYEEACSKYLDNKVDQDRFFKTYSREIKNIVEKEPYKPVFDSFSSVYTAIKKVYEKWYNHEN